jgi:hypothetical protein
MPNESISFEELILQPSAESASQEMRVRRSSTGAQRSQLEKAGDCQTESGWLARASRSSDPDVLKAVARNPNTPKRDLFRLWEMYPETVLQNPILTLWEFTSSKPVASQIPKAVLFSLYQNFLLRRDLSMPEALIPAEWRIFFMKSDDFRPKIALHYFVRDPNERVRLHLLREALEASFQEVGPAEFPLESLQELLQGASRAIKLAFAHAVAMKWLVVEPNAVEFLVETARHFHSLGLDGMIEHLSCWEPLPPDLIEELSQCDRPAILANLAALPRCPHALHERLAAHIFPEVRTAVAQFTTCAELQERLAGDSDSKVRAGVAASLHISDDMQRRLLAPKNADIHLALLKNPRVLPDVLASLARLPHTGIKNQIITHPNLPEEVFDELMADTRLHDVSHERIANTPRLLTTRNYRIHAHRFEPCLFMAYAKKQTTPLDILVELACHRNPEVRKAMAERLLQQTPRHEYSTSDKKAIAIIEAALSHPETPDDHPLLTSRRMSVDQALRIFHHPRFGAVIRFSAVLEKLALFRSSGAFSDYARLYLEIAQPLENLVPHLPTSALRPLTNHSETPAQIRELIRNVPDGNIRASNLAQSHTIPLSALIDAYPEAFPPTGIPRLTATPLEILQKLTTSPHTLLADYATNCLNSSSDKWAKLVGRYPNG